MRKSTMKKIAHSPARRLSRSRAGRRSAFTLIELLLVIVIIGIITAVTLPNLARSISGARLSTSTRMVVTAGRYARSMAVLKQVEVSVVMDLNKGELAVKQGIWYPTAGEDDPESEDGEDRGSDDTAEGADELNDLETVDAEVVDAAAVLDEEAIDLSWRLDRIKIARVEMPDADRVFQDGRCAITYQRNGRCAPYTVHLADEDNKTVIIKVDTIGSARTSLDKELE